MGEFISNVARLLDEARTKDFMAGKLEGNLEATMRIAKNMILKGYNDQAIEEITGLSIEKIKELRKKLDN